MKILEESIKELPGDYKRVLELIYFEGLKYREVAEKLDLSIETVKTQRRRAIGKLRKTLSEKQLFTLWLLTIIHYN